MRYFDRCSLQKLLTKTHLKQPQDDLRVGSLKFHKFGRQSGFALLSVDWHGDIGGVSGKATILSCHAFSGITVAGEEGWAIESGWC